MLQPKKTKFRKMQKGRMKGNAQRGHQLALDLLELRPWKKLGLPLVKLRQLVSQ